MSDKINGRDIDKVITDDVLLKILEANRLLNSSRKIKETHEDKVLKESENKMKGRMTKLFRKSDPIDQNEPEIMDKESFEGVLCRDFFCLIPLHNLKEIQLNKDCISIQTSRHSYFHTSIIMGMYAPNTDQDKVMFALTPDEIKRLEDIKPEGEYAIVTTMNSLYLLDKITHD